MCWWQVTVTSPRKNLTRFCLGVDPELNVFYLNVQVRGGLTRGFGRLLTTSLRMVFEFFFRAKWNRPWDSTDYLPLVFKFKIGNIECPLEAPQLFWPNFRDRWGLFIWSKWQAILGASNLTIQAQAFINSVWEIRKGYNAVSYFFPKWLSGLRKRPENWLPNEGPLSRLSTLSLILHLTNICGLGVRASKN